MNSETEFLEARDGTTLAARVWKTEGRCRGRLLCLHGLSSHPGWFRGLAEELCRDHWEVLAIYQRGYQNHEVETPASWDWQTLLSDLSRWNEEVMGKGLPVFWIGHCWGAMLARRAMDLFSEKPRGVVYLGPGWRTRYDRWDRTMLASFMGGIFKKRLIELPYGAEVFSEREDVREGIRNDSLFRKFIPLGLIRSSFQLRRISSRKEPDSLAIIGKDDRFLRVEKVRQLLEEREIENVLIDGLGHALILEKPAALAQVISPYLARRLKCSR